jgi:sortase A
MEDKSAEEMVQSLLKDVQNIIDEPQLELPLLDDMQKVPSEMATVKVEGYDCIGILSIPVLDLELPVLTDWSYAKLKKAPCHYYGSYYEKDFVIAAHNYKSHFGRLSELQMGDIVFFTDVNGETYYYEVALLETLPKEATKEMITGGFDLSLYTCTPGGASRVTVHCNAARSSN